MNKYPVGFLVVILFTLSGCTASAENAQTSSDCGDVLAAFNDFPDSLFNGICWDQTLTEARCDLHRQGFVQVDSSGAYTYFGQKDSTRVILMNESKVHNLKLVLRSADYLAAGKRLMYTFAETAVSVQQSPEFLIFKYDSDSIDFKLTAFTQQDFIRLNFEQQIRK